MFLPTLAVFSLTLVSRYEVRGSNYIVTRHDQPLQPGQPDPMASQKAILNEEVRRVETGKCVLYGVSMDNIVWSGMPEYTEIANPGGKKIQARTKDLLRCRVINDMERDTGSHNFDMLLSGTSSKCSPENLLRMLELNSFWQKLEWPCHPPLMLNPEWDFLNQRVTKWVPNPEYEKLYKEKMEGLKRKKKEFIKNFFEKHGIVLGDKKSQKAIAEIINVSEYLGVDSVLRLMAKVLVKQGVAMSPFQIKTLQLLRADD